MVGESLEGRLSDLIANVRSYDAVVVVGAGYQHSRTNDSATPGSSVARDR